MTAELGEKPFPKNIVRAIVICIAAIAICYAGPLTVTKHHTEAIQYCKNHKGAASIWFGSFGAGAAVLCRDNSTDPYVGEVRQVDDDQQASYLPTVRTAAWYALLGGTAALLASLLLLIRWHWQR